MSDQPMPAGAVVARSCVTCGAELSGDYCAACGQKIMPPLTLRALLWRVVQAVDVDGNLLATARGLLLRPGAVIDDWMRGRTVPYTGPFAFIGLGFAAAAFTVVQTGAAHGSGGGVIMYLVAPLVLVLAGRLIFLRSPHKLAAHLVANLYLLGEDMLLSVPLFLCALLPGRAALVAGRVGLPLLLLLHTRGLGQALGGRWHHYLGALVTVALAAAALIYVMTVGLAGVFAAAAGLLR